MQYFRRIFPILIVVVILFACTAPCFAAVSALTAAEQFLALWSMYSEAVGIDSVYSTNGIRSGVNNPFSRSVAVENIKSLYNQYCTFSGRVETLSDTTNWIRNGIELGLSIGQTGTFRMSPDVTRFFDTFTTWMLEDVVGIAKDALTGKFSTEKPWFNNNLLYTFSAGAIEYGTNRLVQINELEAYGTVTYRNEECNVYFENLNDSELFIGCASNRKRYYVLSKTYNDTAKWKLVSPTTTYHNFSTILCTEPCTINGDTWYYANSSTVTTWSDNVPIVSYFPPTSNDVLTQTDQEGNRIQLGPKDLYNDGAIGIPDVDAQDYTPDAITGVLTKEAVDGITPALDDVLTDTLQKVLTNTQVLADTITQPAVISSPFVPFGDIPSFGFGFSGIWHYVVEWVSSLGSGLSFFGSIWSNLPYAMIVPIWAAAVVVIVTSIFKRFV